MHACLDGKLANLGVGVIFCKGELRKYSVVIQDVRGHADDDCGAAGDGQGNKLLLFVKLLDECSNLKCCPMCNEESSSNAH